MVDMIPVQSSNVEAVGYDADAMELHVRYLTGPSIYVYQAVPSDTFDRLMLAPSKGVFINQEIKKGGFQFYII